MKFFRFLGATIAGSQSVDVLKEPLLESLKKYDPQSQKQENLDITQAWDDVQKEVSIAFWRVVIRVKNQTTRVILIPKSFWSFGQRHGFTGKSMFCMIFFVFVRGISP